MKHLQDTIVNTGAKIKIGNTAYGCTVEKGGADGHGIGPPDTTYNAACLSTFASQFQVCIYICYILLSFGAKFTLHKFLCVYFSSKALNRDPWFIWSFTGFSDLWDQ